MNILFFLHSFGMGGAERRCATIANYFVSHGHRVISVLLDSPDVLFKLDKRVEIVYLPDIENEVHLNANDTDKIKTVLKSKKNIDRYNLREKNSLSKEMIDKIIESYSKRISNFVTKYPDFIVISWVTLYSISCAVALENLPNKFVIVECNSPKAEFPEAHYFNSLKRRWYLRSQLAIFQTNEQKEYYDFLTNTEKVVIPNPVADFGIDRFTGERRKVIVTYSRLKKAKRIPLLIDAFGRFKEEFPDYKLHIFGNGPEHDLIIEYIKEKKLVNSVVLFDSDVNVHKKVYDCAMFVSASEREGMSNSMIEALSIGLPAICTDCYGGGARDIIKNGTNGILVPMEDEFALYSAMKMLATDTALSDAISENAVKIKDVLSEDTICLRWLNAIRKVYRNI